MAKVEKIILEENSKAPDFTLQGDDGKSYTLGSFKGKKIIIYFYPKDNTPGCTKQAVGFTEHLEEFNQLGYTIIGISPDSIKSHQRFREKQDLKIILLADEDKTVANSYGAYGEKMNYGKIFNGIIRSTFIIDEEGNIINALYNVKATGHVERILKNIKEVV